MLVDHARWPLPPRGTPTSPVWRSAGFEQELAAWCASVLSAEVGLTAHKVRCWSAVWRVEAEGNAYFAKQNCPGQAFEATLLPLLARISDRVIPVVATDPERGFLLTPDQGPVFGDTAGADVAAWETLAREGALLQRELADHLDEMERAGCTRLGPDEASTYLATRIEQLAALPEGDRGRLEAEQADELRRLLPTVAGWAEEVGALGLPLTLNHSDLHDHNAFLIDGRFRFFDFGDAVVSDPLGVLLTTLRVVRGSLDCGEDDPRLARVSDAAIEVWSDLAPPAEMRAALTASLQLAKLARAESWMRCLPSMTPEEQVELGDAATYWLRFLVASPFEDFD